MVWYEHEIKRKLYEIQKDMEKGKEGKNTDNSKQIVMAE